MIDLLPVLYRASIDMALPILFVLLLCRLSPGMPAGWRCWLWRLTLIKSLFCLVVLPVIPLPVLPVPQAERASLPSERAAPPRKVLPVRESALPVTVRVGDMPVTAVRAMSMSPTIDTGVLVTIGYLIGLVCLVVRLIGMARLVYRWRHGAVAVSPPELASLRKRFLLRRSPTVFRSPAVMSPVLAFGAIFLPVKEVPDEGVMLAHEFAHLKRQDLFWESVGVLVQTVFYYHPLVYLVRYEERLAREQAADALTVARTAVSPADYARVLLSASLARSSRSFALTVGVFERGSRLRQRLEALAYPRLSRKQGMVLASVTAVAMVPVLLPWRAVARQESSVPVVTASPVPSAPLQSVSSPQEGVMSGVITDSGGRPVAGAKVSWAVPSEPKPSIIAETVTDGRGRFAFAKIPGSQEGFPNFREYWRLRLDGWILVKASSYGLGVKRVRYENRAVTLRLTPPHSYKATFKDRNSNPVAGLPVWADSLENGHTFFPLKWLGYSGVSDAKGVFAASGLSADDKVWFRFDTRKTSVLEQQQTGSDFVYTVGKGYTLEGTVRFPDGRPVARANVQIGMRGASRPPNPDSDTTDSQGRFRITGCNPGAYGLRVWVYPAIRYIAPGDIPVQIPENSRSTTIRRDVTLVTAARIVGQVTDTTGKPVAMVPVSVFSNQAYTDSAGRYRLSVPPGSNTIDVNGLASREIDASVDHEIVLNFRIDRDKRVQLQGQVWDSQGRPLVGTNIGVFGKRMKSGAFTDSQGRFTWQQQPMPEEPLTVWAHQGNEGAIAVVPPRGNQPLALRLSQANVGYLTGRVMDANGQPLLKTKIEVMEEGITHRDKPMITDNAGRFRITAGPGLEYYVQCSQPGYGGRMVPNLYYIEGVSKPGRTPGITVKAGETKDIGDIVLVRGKDRATGRLFDEGHKLLANAVVMLSTASGMWMGKTDSGGTFTLPGVIQGESGTLIISQSTQSTLRSWFLREQTVGAMGDIQLTEKDLPQPPRKRQHE